MSRLARISPVVLILLSACKFDPGGDAWAGGININNSNNANDNTNFNANDNTNFNANDNTNTNTGYCGDEIVDDGEDCDGSNLNSATCVTLGYAGSGLACDDNCQHDVSSCDPPVTCGNGSIDTGEECDGADLQGASCGSLGYHGTGLVCVACHYDTSACDGRCGDGHLDPAYEDCDGADLGGQDCTTVGAGIGVLACTGACVLDLSGCFVPPEVCDDHTDNDGDGAVDCVDTECTADPWCVNGYSTEFETSAERVQIGSLQDVTGNSAVGAFSVSFWVKFNGNQDYFATPLGVSSDDHWDDGFGFYQGLGGVLRFWINVWDGGTRASTSTGLADDGWHHVVGTYDPALGSDNIKIYLNGALSGTGDSKAAVTESGRPISIGALYTDDMAGFVDEVAFWPTVLSPQNVTAIYNAGSPFNLTYDHGNYNQSATLSAYYRMGDQDILPVIIDHVGSHNGSVVVGDGDEFVTDVP